MKSLSPLLYSKRNKRKLFSSINAVMIAVSFLFVLYAFMNSLMYMEERNSILIYENTALVMNYGEKPIDTKLVKEVAENKNVDRIIQTNTSYSIKYNIPGVSDRAVAVPLTQEDMSYFMDKQNIKLVKGRLPQKGFKEVAINQDIAKNRKVTIGDKVGDSINKFDGLPGEYEIVGIIDSKPLMSILSVNEKIETKGNYYVFPKQGKKDAMDTYLENIPKGKIDVHTKQSVKEAFDRTSGPAKVIDIIAILSIIVMVVTVGSSKYAQYFNRKEELGIFNALGYAKNQILKKSFKEVLIINSLGFILGIALGIIMNLGLAKGVWEPSGAKGFLFTTKGFVVALFIPMFTTLFTVIPINNLINKLDPIKMIEKN